MKWRLLELGKALAGRLRGRGTSARAERGRPPGLAAGAPFDFDALARDVAAGLSRREALRRLGAGLGSAIVFSLGFEATAGAATTAPTKACSPPCAKGQLCCGGLCVNPQNDPNNCGKCGGVCPSKGNCVNGVCTCPAGQSVCNGACV